MNDFPKRQKQKRIMVFSLPILDVSFPTGYDEIQGGKRIYKILI